MLFLKIKRDRYNKISQLQIVLIRLSHLSSASKFHPPIVMIIFISSLYSPKAQAYFCITQQNTSNHFDQHFCLITIECTRHELVFDNQFLFTSRFCTFSFELSGTGCKIQFNVSQEKILYRKQIFIDHRLQKSTFEAS